MANPGAEEKALIAERPFVSDASTTRESVLWGKIFDARLESIAPGGNEGADRKGGCGTSVQVFGEDIHARGGGGDDLELAHDAVESHRPGESLSEAPFDFDTVQVRADLHRAPTDIDQAGGVVEQPARVAGQGGEGSSEPDGSTAQGIATVAGIARLRWLSRDADEYPSGDEAERRSITSWSAAAPGAG